MAFKETLAAAREQRGMTQQDLAEKLYVTRQAVSRWENGETEPSVDMRKLIATVLDVPVIQLFDIDVSQLCQCCGTPFTVPNMPHGTDADGAENDSYCKWCYDGGQFVYQARTSSSRRRPPSSWRPPACPRRRPSPSWASSSLTCSTGRSSARLAPANGASSRASMGRPKTPHRCCWNGRKEPASARLSPPGARLRYGCRERSCAA